MSCDLCLAMFMKDSILYIRLYELCLATRLFLGWLVSKMMPTTPLWLISERGQEARDNAYALYKYMRKDHPEVPVRYVIGHRSQDLERICASDRIYYRSWRHYIYLWRATHLISTHICGFSPDLDYVHRFEQRFHMFRNKKIVFLQHGIIMNNLPYLYGDNVDIDLFVCGALPEFEYVKANFRHNQGVVQYTGLCRYDTLKRKESSKKQILLMPTWRVYINKDTFERSTYYLQYSQLLCNCKLHELLCSFGYSLVFYPHYEMQRYIQLFKQLSLPSYVKIADFNYDIQSLFIDSDLLITDYSSVFFDMLYMGKPTLFYQFDKEEFYDKHYEKGYLDLEVVGPSATNIDELLENLRILLCSQCKMSDTLLDFSKKFFPISDNKNCERVYNAISSINK